jgi:FKBP-type peptidyl-prolyl cis-trans isomerase
MKLQHVAMASALALVAPALASAQAPKAAATAPAAPVATDSKDLRVKASYALGLNMGKSFKAQNVDLDPEGILKGLKEGLAGGGTMTEEQIREVMTAYQAELSGKMASTAKASGEAFLKANAAKPGVKTTASGLQYAVVKEGNGPSPKASDTVTVHYTGKLVDGKVFDSSVERGQPASFGVGQVIKGWTEALQLMKVGSKYQLVIPSELAYGSNPRQGGPIPPNAVLIFDVELLGIGEGK